ncbi:hypothetical protein AUEXF2481DRAFT_36161 [Aureobasidium subglaciale EXF-2481]|uniref:Uncharacterized protein n=1 Tax=Aureobasidium subglaciale (strain EXF-2481) TaxID=1043005 RepID=A0A074YMD5_AURSE|nr:uncharacterized protein AUEXF2481DRAFT_36161 [Aureobasidium subglaciale EXF-2481]KEQ98850.1 hypothetical protein AUEXF2481DRAFT_36161 [Aureobasidium subglaciale EXF-2481]
MFCLRTWLPVLFFISNVPPLYLVLFISAMYYLNRPCVYCSLLLTVLVISVYDFNTNWFEPQPESSSSSSSSSSSHPGNLAATALGDNIAVATSAIQSAAASIAQSVADGLTKKTGLDVQSQISVAEWLKELFNKKEWRIPCIDVAVRL